jgi:hypothetical protein
MTYALRLHVFGQYQYKVLIGCFVLGVLVMHFNGPTFQDVPEYRDQRIKADQESFESDKHDK